MLRLLDASTVFGLEPLYFRLQLLDANNSGTAFDLESVMPLWQTRYGLGAISCCTASAVVASFGMAPPMMGQVPAALSIPATATAESDPGRARLEARNGCHAQRTDERGCHEAVGSAHCASCRRSRTSSKFGIWLAGYLPLVSREWRNGVQL